MKYLFILFLIIQITFNSCSESKITLVEKNDLNSVFILNSSASFDGYFYLGSDDSFHYFNSEWFLESNKYFKVSITNLKVNKTIKLGDKPRSITLIKKDGSQIFGTNEYYKLYYHTSNN